MVKGSQDLKMMTGLAMVASVTDLSRLEVGNAKKTGTSLKR